MFRRPRRRPIYWRAATTWLRAPRSNREFRWSSTIRSSRWNFPTRPKHPEWNSTNRRLILAKWMVSPENPLVPRVFVNRVWQWHFGEGIVRSVDDFGTQGAKPTHPELLDYLTVSFEEHNWDLKWLTKEIMMSQVYRQGSAEVPEYLAADPSDKLLWRKAPLRLEAETIRDSMLKVSGLLNERMFGKQEPIKRGPDGQWLEDNQGHGASRRSLYLAQTRTRSVASCTCSIARI